MPVEVEHRLPAARADVDDHAVVLESSLRMAWNVGPNLLLEGGWLYLIKGSYYSNLLNQGVAGSPTDKNTDYVFLSMRLFF
jgi:hypothetical protein